MLYFMFYNLKYYFRNFFEIIYIYGLFVSIVVLAPFAVNHDDLESIASLAPLILWVALMTSVSLAGALLFRRESEEGRLEYYQLLPIPLEQLLLAKWGAFFLMLAVPLLIMLPFAGLLLGIPSHHWLHYAVGLVAGAAALSSISALTAAITTGLERAASAISLMILPLGIPVLIFGVQYCQAPGDFLQINLLFLIGFSCFLLPIYCFAGASCIRAAN